MSRSPNSVRYLPIAVQTVVEFGFPLTLVMSTYKQLSACSQNNDGVQQPGSHQAGLGATSGTYRHHVVNAEELFLAVEALESRSTSENDDQTPQCPQAVTMISGKKTGAGQEPSDLQDDGSEDGETPSKSENTHPQESTTAAENSSGSRPTSETVISAHTTSPGTEATTNTVPNDGSHLASVDVLPIPVPAAGLDSTSADTSEETVVENSTLQTVTDAVSTSTSDLSSSQTSVAEFQTPASTNWASWENAQTGAGSLRDTTLSDEKARERRRQLTKLRALREENRRLKERQTCRHCRQKPVELTLLPCGHFCFCLDCGASFNSCPLCGKTIVADVRTFV